MKIEQEIIEHTLLALIQFKQRPNTCFGDISRLQSYLNGFINGLALTGVHIEESGEEREKIWQKYGFTDIGAIHPIHKMRDTGIEEQEIIDTACDMLVDQILSRYNIPKTKLVELEERLEEKRKHK